MSTTYAMEYLCSNCGSRLQRAVPKGTPAKGHGGTCGYCGMVDSGSFSYGRPFWLQQAEAMQNMHAYNESGD